MVRYLTENDVGQLLPMDRAVDVVEEAFRQIAQGQGENMPRHRVHSPVATMHLMAASLPVLGFMGLKVYTVVAGCARFLVYLYSSETGELLALIEANRLGQTRTGAASGVASRWMARSDSRIAGIFGSGWQARSQLQAVCRVRPIQQVIAFSRSPLRVQEFCRELEVELGISCLAARDPQEVVEQADILITITNSATPVFSGDWLKLGTHINAAGSNYLIKRELDETCVTRCHTIVVDSKEQARAECGELLSPLQKGILNWNRILELGDVVTERAKPRTDSSQITLFKSLGLGSEDIAVAAEVYRRASIENIGKSLDSSGFRG
ncbi:MAG TPA: ornithine cyclodeaminase family protein [Terriglobia bacterium]|nr:ornithine cyclodeaminase family protein [Terriglobia bacterium]